LVAVIATFFTQGVQGGVPVFVSGMLVGGVAGFAGARMVKMTAMPQMVALFNGAGGGAAALVSILEFSRELGAGRGTPPFGVTLPTLLALVIGAVSFSGSAIAFGKLQGIVTPRAFRYAGQQVVAGTLVGASGTILTRLMSKAMNRSLGNVLFGAFGAATAAGAAGPTGGDDGRTIRSIGPEDAAILLSYAQNVIVVPGYGLAVA